MTLAFSETGPVDAVIAAVTPITWSYLVKDLVNRGIKAAVNAVLGPCKQTHRTRAARAARTGS